MKFRNVWLKTFLNYLLKISLNLDITSMICHRSITTWTNNHLTFQLTLYLYSVKHRHLFFLRMMREKLVKNYFYLLSNRIWYPIVWPILSLLSAATLSATAIAAKRLGWVQNIRQGIPFLKQSSNRNWGIWNTSFKVL